MRAKQVEDALFIANDKFDEVNKEKHELAEQLSMIDQRHQEERENWDIEKEKLEHNLRYEAPKVIFYYFLGMRDC